MNLLRVSTVMRWVVVPLLLLNYFNFLSLRIQFEVLGWAEPKLGTNHLLLAIWSVFAVLALATAASSLSGSRPRGGLRGWTLLFAAALVVCAVSVNNVLYNGRDAAYVFQTSKYIYGHMLVAITVLLLAPEVVDRAEPPYGRSLGWLWAFLLMAPAVFGLGFAQFLLDQPLLSTGETVEFLRVNNPIQAGTSRQRAFSVFSSGYEYGHYISQVFALVGASAIAMSAAHTRRKWVAGILFVVCALATYSTQTRNSFIELALVAMGLYAARTYSWRRFLLSNVVISFGLLALMLTMLAPQVRAGGLFDSQSLAIRMARQANVIQQYLVGYDDIWQLLFGYGLMQDATLAVRDLVVDSTALVVFLYSGVVGVAVWFVGIGFVAARFYDRWHLQRSVPALAAVSVCYSYIFVASMNVYTVEFSLFLAICAAAAVDRPSAVALPWGASSDC